MHCSISLVTAALASVLQILPLTSALQAQDVAEPIVLPTLNDHLLRGENEKFYMYVYRNFEGQESRPWTAGKYGFVRTLRRTDDGLVCTKFHEGIDIKPLQRDRRNNPLDEVCAIAAGKVVYVNATSGRSNYGKYIVIEHPWQCGPIYSLYAHLSGVKVKAGQKVETGQGIGQLGYTGAGLNRDRAHLHLELGLKFTTRYPDWHGKHFTSPNHHGNYNGINITGLDIASFYLARKENPGLSLPQFVKSIPVHYKVTVPRSQVRGGTPELLSRYPWLCDDTSGAHAPSWEFAFSDSGFPVSINPSNRVVSAPSITSIQKCRSKHDYHTKGFVSGTGPRGTLSNSGQRFIQLVCGQF